MFSHENLWVEKRSKIFEIAKKTLIHDYFDTKITIYIIKLKILLISISTYLRKLSRRTRIS